MSEIRTVAFIIIIAVSFFSEFEILPMECNLSNVLEKECNRMDNVLNKRDSYAPGF